MKNLDRRALLFALNTYLAAMLALFVAFSLDLPRPFWAMITAFITSQNSAGAVRSKAVFRITGTLVGSLVALLLVPALDDAPLLLTVALALWISFCLGVSLLDRTPRSYGFMLAGYTAALVGLPSVLAPGQIFATAVARAEEISLGALAATLVHGVVFPVPLLPKFRADLARMLAEAEAWAADALARRDLGVPRLAIDRRRFAADTTELFLQSTHLPYDASASPESRSLLIAIQDRLVQLLPLISAVEDRLLAMDRYQAALPERVEILRQRLWNWLRHEEASRVETARLIQEIRSEARELAEGGERGWLAMLFTNLYRRLIEVVENIAACRALLAALAPGAGRLPAELRALLNASHRRDLHADPLIALRSAVAVFFTVIVSTSLWILTGWADGGICTSLAAVFACMFAAQDDPRPALRSMMLYTLLSVPVTAFCSFAILPSIDGFPLLALALAPCLIAIGYFMGRPATNLRAMGFMLGFMGGLAVQSAYNADFSSFINANVAQLVGAFIALVVVAVTRVIGLASAARRLVRLTARDLAQMAAGKSLPSQAAWASRMIDREGLLQQRLARIDPPRALARVDLLTDLRTGVNLLALSRARRSLPEERAIENLQRALQAFFRTRARRLSAQPEPELLAALDLALQRFRDEPNSPDHRDGVAALVGLRRNLFPRAAAPGFVS